MSCQYLRMNVRSDVAQPRFYHPLYVFLLCGCWASLDKRLTLGQLISTTQSIIYFHLSQLLLLSFCLCLFSFLSCAYFSNFFHLVLAPFNFLEHSMLVTTLFLVLFFFWCCWHFMSLIVCLTNCTFSNIMMGFSFFNYPINVGVNIRFCPCLYRFFWL